jgi:hypothetical protein
MRAYWILPNRDQGDTVLASDGERIRPLRQILDPKLRPEGFSHGVPTELLEKWGAKDKAEILFAQRFTGWNGDKQILSVATPAGQDCSGRVVHLGLLYLLDRGERPTFELPYGALSKEDQAYASALLRRMTSSRRGDVWAQSVRDLNELPPNGPPATNVALDRSVVRFHSPYVLGPRGLIKKAIDWRKPRTTAIILLVLFTVVGACLTVRACDQSSRPAIHMGVMTWRFS